MSCTCKYGSGNSCQFCQHRKSVNERLTKLEKSRDAEIESATAVGRQSAIAAIVADLRKRATVFSNNGLYSESILLAESADRYEQGKHEDNK